MPNIFGGLEKLSDDDIRLQIALFQSVTLGNAVKETSFKAVGKIVDFANMFTGKNGDSTSKIDFQTKGVEDIVLSQVENLKNTSRTELDEIFRTILIEKCNLLNTNSANESSSDDLLSILIIREAAKVYTLNSNMSPATLAEKIDKKYYEQFLNRLHKNLLKETPEQAKITDNNLQQYLNKASIDLIRDMSKKIILKELSGKGIGRAIRTEAGIKNITVVVDCLGLEAFDILKTIIASIYDTVLGINRVSRAILAQLVWVSVNAYGMKFTVNRESLPNYVPAIMRLEQDNEEKEYLILLANRKDLKNKINSCNLDIEKFTSKIMNLKEKLLELNTEFNESKAKFDELESKKYEYENHIEKPREEIKRYYSDVISAKRNYDNADLNLKKQTIQISDFEIKLSQRKIDMEQYSIEFAIADENANKLITQYSTQLEILWQAYFYRFEFSTNMFTQVVIDFTKSELLIIEEYLKEMHDSNDIDAYSVKTITYESDKETEETLNKEEVLKCAIYMVSNGKNSEIGYDGIKIKIIRKQ